MSRSRPAVAVPAPSFSGVPFEHDAPLPYVASRPAPLLEPASGNEPAGAVEEAVISVLTLLRAELEASRQPTVYLTAAEAADRLKVGYSTLLRWNRVGSSPPFARLPNGELRTTQAAVDRWLSSLAKEWL